MGELSDCLFEVTVMSWEVQLYCLIVKLYCVWFLCTVLVLVNQEVLKGLSSLEGGSVTQRDITQRPQPAYSLLQYCLQPIVCMLTQVLCPYWLSGKAGSVVCVTRRFYVSRVPVLEEWRRWVCILRFTQGPRTDHKDCVLHAACVSVWACCCYTVLCECVISCSVTFPWSSPSAYINSVLLYSLLWHPFTHAPPSQKS